MWSPATSARAGARALLNLGHTFGHALEAAANTMADRLVHGEGVAIGMVLAHEFSARMNLASPDDAARVERILKGRFADPVVGY
jgi:3-dehydroquinate synthase